jgi:RimJ/RimL family protein N-acetyltransferase
MLKAAIEDFSLKKIKAITNLENYASQKLLEKIGLVKVDKIKLHNDELFLFELSV